MNYDLSIVIAGIRNNNWLSIFDQIKRSIGTYSFELICVGPYFPPKELEDKFNFIFIRDFGTPARCVQLGSTVATGRYICMLVDDCKVEDGALASCIDYMNNHSEKDGMTLVYSEGQNFTGTQHIDLEYWTARTHKSLQLPHIREDWKIAIHFMYDLKVFRDIGGLDSVNYEHANMNTHDLAFRVQLNGGKIHLSPDRVSRADWDPTCIHDRRSAVYAAYDENDLPNFKAMWGKSDFNRPIKIDYNNWMESPKVWKRRFKK